MRDDPRRNLKWLEQELLSSERPEIPDGIAAQKQITDEIEAKLQAAIAEFKASFK